MSSAVEYLVVDIETCPLKISDDSVWVYLTEKVTRRDLHPVFSKIIAIGIKQPNTQPNVIHGDNEREILEKFWVLIDKLKPKTIVTFNGYGFDVPFIYARSSLNKIKPTMRINTNKWNMERSNHFDCMVFFSQYGVFINVAQAIICKMLGIGVPSDIISGPQIEDCYKGKDWKPIIYRCEQDTIMTEELYKKIRR